MPVMSRVPDEAPVMRAWEAHKKTEDYANSLKWATDPQHVEGSLWALFYAGFFACAVHQTADETAAWNTRAPGVTRDDVAAAIWDANNDATGRRWADDHIRSGGPSTIERARTHASADTILALLGVKP